MKDVYKKLYKDGKYNTKVNQNQFNWLFSRDLSDVSTAADFGCGLGHVAKALCEKGIDVVGVDFASALEYDGISFVSGDVRTVDLKKTVDLVVCHDVLEHIPEEDAEKTVKNLAKHTGKFASLAIANHSDIWNGKELHLIRKDINWWSALLEKHFDVMEADGRLNGMLHLFWCKVKSD